MKEKTEPIIVPVKIDEEKLKRIKKLLEEIKISAQEVRELFKNIF